MQEFLYFALEFNYYRFSVEQEFAIKNIAIIDLFQLHLRKAFKFESVVRSKRDIMNFHMSRRY